MAIRCGTKRRRGRPNPVNSGPASPMRLSSVPAPKFADVVRRELAVSRGSQVQRPSTAGVGRSSWSAESKRLALLGPVQWQLSDPYQACCRKRCRLTTLEDSAHNVGGQERQSRNAGQIRSADALRARRLGQSGPPLCNSLALHVRARTSTRTRNRSACIASGPSISNRVSRPARRRKSGAVTTSGAAVSVAMSFATGSATVVGPRNRVSNPRG
jgi:hypothetical protein